RGSDLARLSRDRMARHVERIPADNPFPRFRERFEHDLEWLLAADLAAFHAYSFANLRQYGACFELAGSYLAWLSENGQGSFGDSAAALREIAETAKAFQFQLARAMARRKPLDLSPLDAMALQWDRAMAPLKAAA